MSRLKAEVFKKNTVRTSATIFIEEVHSFDNFDSVCGGSGEKPWGAPKVISTSGSLIRQITVHGVLMIIGWGFFFPQELLLLNLGSIAQMLCGLRSIESFNLLAFCLLSLLEALLSRTLEHWMKRVMKVCITSMPPWG